MKRYIKSSQEVHIVEDGNTTAIYVGLQFGTIKPVYIEAIFHDRDKAEAFKETIESYGDIDEMVDAIYRHAPGKVIVSTDDDYNAIQLC